jgi:hypothetical protein
MPKSKSKSKPKPKYKTTKWHNEHGEIIIVMITRGHILFILFLWFELLYFFYYKKNNHLTLFALMLRILALYDFAEYPTATSSVDSSLKSLSLLNSRQPIDFSPAKLSFVVKVEYSTPFVVVMPKARWDVVVAVASVNYFYLKPKNWFVKIWNISATAARL